MGRTSIPTEPRLGPPGLLCCEEAPRPVSRFGRWRAWLSSLVPLGYQDQTGFHYGEAPKREQISYPPFW